MKNKYTEFLLNNGWIQMNQMNYKLKNDESFELFFNTSNQIELYKNKEIMQDKYLLSLDDLVSFLKKHNLIV